MSGGPEGRAPGGQDHVRSGEDGAQPGEDGMNILALRDVDFAYAEKPVLRHVSFALRPGDFVGVVGPNGSGKSTLVDLIDGMLRPGSGEVLVQGRPAHRYRRREMAREVALVPQQFALDFDLSVREVVEMGDYCRAKSQQPDGDAESTLARLGIAGLAPRRFSELSGGEKQLVVLAQALRQRAGLLLLDEPASALDVAHQLQLFDLLRMLNSDGLTVLCILHDLNLAMHYFDKLLVLSQGEVAAFGRPQEVLTPELLEEVYGVHAYVHHHAGRTFLTFSPRRRREVRGRVHLVCGGGTGSHLMRELVDDGYDVSAGVLNALDGDEAVGRELGLPMAVEAPFSPVGDRAHAENVELMALADLVVLTDVPIGNGNARNVEGISGALAAGKQVWAAAGVRENDFTGTVAQLSGSGLRFFDDEAQLLAELRRRGRL
jgi:iron complex transport system ATP-binding protein